MPIRVYSSNGCSKRGYVASTFTKLGVLNQSEQFARILIKTDNQATKALAENPV